MRSFLSVLCLSLLFSRAAADYGYGLIICNYNSSRDVIYSEQIFYNKLLLGVFNSTLGKYVGYTELARKIVDELNKNPGLLEQANKNKAKCEKGKEVVFDVLTKPVEPTITLRSVEAASSTHPALIVCSAYDFYPRQIKLTWRRNGREVTTDVTSTEELPSGNWLHQIHSQLEVVAAPGEKISCVVEHASLVTPKVYDWDPMSPSDRNKIAVGTAGLVLGLVFLTAGLILYNRRPRHGHHQVPTS